MKIPMTDDRLAAIQEAVEAGWRRADIMAHFQVSERTLIKSGIKTNGHKVVRPGDKRLGSIIPPERIEMIRELSAAGVSERQIAQRMKLSCRQVRRTKEKHGIKAIPMSERPKAEKIETPKNNGRNPMKYIGKWRPPVAQGEIETAVSRLRAMGLTVYDEDTAKYPSRPPKRYTDETKFRVGGMRNVPAAEVLAMVSQRTLAGVVGPLG